MMIPEPCHGAPKNAPPPSLKKASNRASGFTLVLPGSAANWVPSSFLMGTWKPPVKRAPGVSVILSLNGTGVAAGLKIRVSPGLKVDAELILKNMRVLPVSEAEE